MEGKITKLVHYPQGRYHKWNPRHPDVASESFLTQHLWDPLSINRHWHLRGNLLEICGLSYCVDKHFSTIYSMNLESSGGYLPSHFPFCFWMAMSETEQWTGWMLCESLKVLLHFLCKPPAPTHVYGFGPRTESHS